jgi:TRAP-type mannitol/chloroaromatic compound transport system permease large subunit
LPLVAPLTATGDPEPHPPAFSLFYLKGVSPPEIKTGHIYWGIIPFVALQAIGLILVVMFPKMATWFPRLVFGP